MASASDSCAPISLTRDIAEFPIGNIPLSEHHRRWAGETGVTIHPTAWIKGADFDAFLNAESSTLVDVAGNELAWKNESADVSDALKVESSFMIQYPWDLIRANECYFADLGHGSIHGEIHPLAVVDGTVHLGHGSRLLPGVYIEGKVIIGENCKIGPNCYIRGNTSIGDNCHIGQSVEIKNCVILSNTNVGHLSYIGDSVLGEKVNLGAGTTTSNLRHDGKNHRSEVDGTLIDTGRRKFGAIIGDGVHTGINTSIYPGRKLWPHTTTRPGDIVQRDILF